MALEFLEEIGEAISETISDIGEFFGVVEYDPNELFENLRVNPEVDSDTFTGDLEDLENWHEQGTDYTCAICCQEFVAEQLFGVEFSEEKFAEFARENGWLDETGTSFEDVSNILEALGADVEKGYDNSLEDITNYLEDGEKVVCAVNGSMIWYPETYGDMPGMSADHVVQVVAIDTTIPGEEKVIINDSGHPDGQGMEVDLDVFMNAWGASSNFCYSATVGG